MKNKKTKIIIEILLIIIWLVFIWARSMKSINESLGESRGLLKILDPILTKIFGEGIITDHIIRKIAHFTEYAILSFLATNLLNTTDNINLKWCGHTCIYGFFSAFADETIQIFSGRGPEIKDVWIDFGGFTTGMILTILLLEILKKITAGIKRKKNEKRREV